MQLHKPYLAVVKKSRETQEQKQFTNFVQKRDNVSNAFTICDAATITGRTLLLIDDIYDSGCIMREVATTLKQADVSAIYPFTITRTLHSDDQ